MKLLVSDYGQRHLRLIQIHPYKIVIKSSNKRDQLSHFPLVRLFPIVLIVEQRYFLPDFH